MRTIIWTLNLVIFLAVSLWGFPSLAQTEDGLSLFRSAYENRYTWDKDFPGYTADVLVTYKAQTFSGKVKVTPDLKVEVSGIEAEEIRQSVENVLKMEVIHRRRLDFERVHGNKDFAITAKEADGVVVIKELGDEQDSFYRVQNRQIRQVNRTFDENISVTVDTLATTPVAEGYLASSFKTIFRNPETQTITEIETVKDEHSLVGNYYLLSAREIESVAPEQTSERILMRFDNFHLLKTAANTSR